MDFSKIVYSQKPITLRENILCQKYLSGDYSALLDYILCRTDIPWEEALELDAEDIAVVVGGIAVAVLQAQQLQLLARGLE